jgi:hypothetical protein
MPRNKLIKEVKDLYNKNCESLKKEIREENWKTSHVHGSDLTVKLAMVMTAIFKFNAIPIKIPMSFFTEVEKSILKLHALDGTIIMKPLCNLC